MLIHRYCLIVFSLIGVFDNGFDVRPLNFGKFVVETVEMDYCLVGGFDNDDYH